jgi:hypothetical protein
MKPAVPIVLVALVLGAAACGGSESSGGRMTYPSAAERSFLAACARQPGATAVDCACILDRVRDRIPYGELRRLGPAIRSNGTITPETRRQLVIATAACAA